MLKLPRLFVGIAFSTLCLVVPLGAQESQTDRGLTLDSLLNIQISAAARYEQVSSEAPASITVLTRDDLDRYGFLSVAEALETLRGFYSTFDRMHLNMGIRGFGRPSDTNNRILLLVDGVPWNDAGNDQAAIGTSLSIAIETVDRIEVVRGPGSALYGSSAMFAVINIVTRDGASVDGVEGGIEMGSYGLRGAWAMGGTRIPGGFDLSVSALVSEQRGPDLFFPEFAAEPGGGHLSGRDDDSHYGWGAVVRRQGLMVALRGSGQRKGDPTAPYGSVFDTDGTFREFDRISGVMRYEQDLTPRLGVRAEWFGHETGIGAGMDYDPPRPDRIVDIDGPRWGADLQVRYDPRPSTRLIFGIAHQRLDPVIRIRAGEVQRPDLETDVNLLSGFAQGEWQALSDLSIVVGLRADEYNTVGSALSPRAALVYHPSSSTSLKLLYGSAFRAPTVLEQFIDEPGVLVANEGLEPERIRQVEAVLEQRLGSGLHVAVSAFDYSMSDLIGQAFRVSDGLLEYQNLDAVRSRGISAEVVGRFDGGTSLFANGVLQRTEDKQRGTRLANSPPYQLRAGASVPLPADLRLGAVATFDAERETLHGFVTDSYARVNLVVTSPGIRGVTASLAFRNVFDATYLHPGGLEHRQVGIPQDGRNFVVKLSASF